MISIIFGNWPWKLLSLVLAIAIWVAVASEPEMTTFLRVPVQFKNAPRDLEISSDIAGTVRLELVGSSGRLKEISASPSPAVLDFSGVRAPGERTFSVDKNVVRLPRGVRLVNSVPAQLRFVFEKQVRKSVPVEVRWSGMPLGGKHITAVLNPPALTVIGPESRVNLVDSVATDPVDLRALKSGDMVVTSPYVTEPQVRLQNFEPVHVRVVLK